MRSLILTQTIRFSLSLSLSPFFFVFFNFALGVFSSLFTHTTEVGIKPRKYSFYFRIPIVIYEKMHICVVVERYCLNLHVFVFVVGFNTKSVCALAYYDKRNLYVPYSLLLHVMENLPVFIHCVVFAHCIDATYTHKGVRAKHTYRKSVQMLLHLFSAPL